MKKAKVWDIYTRLFHWGLAASVITCFIALEVNNMDLHMNAGLVTLGLIIFRILWGIWGFSTARFSNFIRGPKAIFAYIKTGYSQSIGHNPLGALSVIAMLSLIGFQSVAGLFASAPDSFIFGPFSEEVSAETSGWFTHWHERNGDLIKILIFLHLGAILFYRVFRKKKLVSAMITGNGDVQNQEYYKKEKPNNKMAAISIMISAAIVYFIFVF